MLGLGETLWDFGNAHYQYNIPPRYFHCVFNFLNL